MVALGVGEGDEVILPAFTYPATANVVVHVGAKPVFVDIELETFNIDPGEILKRLSAKTRVIMPVHLFGLPANMDEVMEIARSRGLAVVEDAACAMGAEYKGVKVGTIGDCGAFSFHPRKPITTGEGGIFTTNNGDLAEVVKALRSHGETVSDESRHRSGDILYPDYRFAGYNYRMTDIQAAIGVEQVKKFPYILGERRRIAAAYSSLLSGLEDAGLIGLPRSQQNSSHTYQSYVVLIKGDASRDRISYELQQLGISTRKGTYHVPLTSFYRERFGFRSGDFPNSELAEARSLALPLYVGMGEEEIGYVVENLEKLVRA